MVEKYVWLEGMCVVGVYVWLRCVVDGCEWFGSVCSFGMNVVLGGVWLEGCGWLRGMDGYGVWVVVEYVWLEGYGWSQGCNWLKVWVVEGDYAQINT